MPRENKQRGRRAEKKRKYENANSEPVSHKRWRLATGETAERDEGEDSIMIVHGEAGDDFVSFQLPEQPLYTAPELQFYGLLTQEESEYYASVTRKLDLDDFENDDDRSLFIQAVHRETLGKELKLASSQSSSRILERVIRQSGSEQLKELFGRFLGNLSGLISHRFASHVVETLFERCAGLVGHDEQTTDVESLEILFLKAVEEIRPDVGYLLTERFGSHTIRVLLLVLSGQPFEDKATKAVIASRKKEQIEQSDDDWRRARSVPRSFSKALYSLIQAAVSSLNTTYLRTLATHPTGGPVLQLLLRLDLSSGGSSKGHDDVSILRRLLPDDSLAEETDSAKFVQGLLYDPTGSHLIETIVQYAPGKVFKKVYKNLLKDRLSNMAKNDIASYVVCKVLERLGKDELKAARDQILPEIPALVDRHRTGLVRVLVERCAAREVDMTPLVASLKAAYGDDKGGQLLKMLKMNANSDEPKWKTSKDGPPDQEKSAQVVDLHGSLLAQAMLRAPVACIMVQESLLDLPKDLILRLSKDATASRIIQQALTADMSTSSFRKKLIPLFYGHMSEMSTDRAGSHVADALGDGTKDLQFMKERLAKELFDHREVIRESSYGRNVWRNWSMDLYTARPREWFLRATGKEEQVTPQQELLQKKKTPIELAREKFAEKRKAGFPKQHYPAGVPASG